MLFCSNSWSQVTTHWTCWNNKSKCFALKVISVRHFATVMRKPFFSTHSDLPCIPLLTSRLSRLWACSSIPSPHHLSPLQFDLFWQYKLLICFPPQFTHYLGSRPDLPLAFFLPHPDIPFHLPYTLVSNSHHTLVSYLDVFNNHWLSLGWCHTPENSTSLKYNGSSSVMEVQSWEQDNSPSQLPSTTDPTPTLLAP